MKCNFTCIRLTECPFLHMYRIPWQGSPWPFKIISLKIHFELKKWKFVAIYTISLITREQNSLAEVWLWSLWPGWSHIEKPLKCSIYCCSQFQGTTERGMQRSPSKIWNSPFLGSGDFHHRNDKGNHHISQLNWWNSTYSFPPPLLFGSFNDTL